MRLMSSLTPTRAAARSPVAALATERCRLSAADWLRASMAVEGMQVSKVSSSSRSQGKLLTLDQAEQALHNLGLDGAAVDLIEENVEASLCIVDHSLLRGRGGGSDALQLARQDVEDGPVRVGDVRTIARRVLGARLGGRGDARWDAGPGAGRHCARRDSAGRAERTLAWEARRLLRVLLACAGSDGCLAGRRRWVDGAWSWRVRTARYGCAGTRGTGRRWASLVLSARWATHGSAGRRASVLLARHLGRRRAKGASLRWAATGRGTARGRRQS